MENNRFTYWIIILPIVAVILTSTILTFEFLSYEKNELEEEKSKIRTEYVEEIKNTIENRVNRIINLIETNIKLTYDEEKRGIVDIVNIGYKTISQIYEENKHLEEKEIIHKISNSLKDLRFYNNASGYFFIIDLNDKVVMQPQTPSHEGKIVSHIKDKNGKEFIQSFKNIVIQKGEGFDTWYWSKPKTNKVDKKIGYVKLFKPLNIYIGTAKYEEDILKRIENDAKKIIDTIKFSKDEYLFAISPEGVTLSHINKSFIGKPLNQQTKIEQDIISNILKKASKEGGSFLGYTPTSHNVSKKLSKKISFVKTLPSLGWAIGTGQYTKKIEEEIKRKEDYLKKELEETIYKILIISSIIAIILILILTYIAKKLQNRFTNYEIELTKNNNKLKELNENLESKVKEQIIKIREKEEMLNQQSKLASMGEMIGNIAHQWRQPLSTISTVASGIKLQDELNILKKETMGKNLEIIIDNTQLLSQTIEDFRNFFKKEKEKTSFYLDIAIEKVLYLISASMTNKDIIIKTNIEHIQLYNLENEFKQAILNILNNAKDALLEKKQKYKIIDISSKQIEDKIHIFIKDNAGGIDPSIIDKIFEPYFTTKFKAQGTGIGLYMTRTIITHHMNGQILVRNEDFTYKDEKYTAAVFEVILDKKG